VRRPLGRAEVAGRRHEHVGEERFGAGALGAHHGAVPGEQGPGVPEPAGGADRGRVLGLEGPAHLAAHRVGEGGGPLERLVEVHDLEEVAAGAERAEDGGHDLGAGPVVDADGHAAGDGGLLGLDDGQLGHDLLGDQRGVAPGTEAVLEGGVGLEPLHVLAAACRAVSSWPVVAVRSRTVSPTGKRWAIVRPPVGAVLRWSGSKRNRRWPRARRAAAPAGPRSGGATRAATVGSMPSAPASRSRPWSSCASSSSSRPASARASTETSTYGRASTVRPCAASRRLPRVVAAVSSSRPARASTVSGTTSRVTGTSGTAARAPASRARAWSSRGATATVPSGARAGEAPSSAVSATASAGAGSPGRGPTTRWVTSSARTSLSGLRRRTWSG
jgi:hypothetical protein